MVDVLAIIGAVGGVIGILAAAVNLFIMWRGRSRLDFRILKVHHFIVPYTQAEIDSVKGGPTPGWKPFVEPGDIRRAFSIIEFSVTNNYPTAVTIGRMDIDGWMYSDHWHVPMYGFPQDYRAFDLTSRDRVDLSHYYQVPSKSVLARRIEVYEDTHGPEWRSSKSRYSLETREQFVITIHSDVRTLTKTVSVKPEIVEAWELERGKVPYWSDLLPEWKPDSRPAPKP